MRLDPDSPVPLYHQLAEAIRYRIATGTLPAGAILPPLRRAAEEWGVNLHTVRHAYKALGAEGLVRTRPPHGTVVLASGGNGGGGSGSGGGGGGKARQRASDLEQFLVRVVREAGERFNLGPDELRRRLAGVREDGGSEAPALAHVVECSETQAADLAHQVAAAWTVRAEGWSLSDPAHRRRARSSPRTSTTMMSACGGRIASRMPTSSPRGRTPICRAGSPP